MRMWETVKFGTPAELGLVVMGQLDDTYGCLFLASIFSTALWAVGCVQLWFYVEKYFDTDKLWLKIYVILLWVLDTVYLILLFKFTYIYLVKEFGNTDFLDNLPKDVYQSAAFSPIISSMVQSLFVMRAWNLSNRNYLLTGVLAFLVMAQFSITMVYIAKMRPFEHLEQLLTIVEYERAMNIITFITDSSIALVLMTLLWSRRSGFKRTEGLIKRLVTFTIGTGFIVGVTVILAFIFAEARPESMAYILIDYCTAKMYYNCMLASLNARSSLRGDTRNTTMGGISFRLDDISSAGTASDLRSRSTTVFTSVASRAQREYDPRAIECRVQMDVDSESNLKKHDRDGSQSIFHEPTNKVGVDSAV